MMDSMTNKTGKGRSNHARRVSEVEEVACLARKDGGNHLLTNRELRTFCRFCQRSWGDLDLELNGERN